MREIHPQKGDGGAHGYLIAPVRELTNFDLWK
jgi:hypothetical protein